MRYASVGSTTVAVPRLRRRLGVLVCNKCRLPARMRRTLPPAVILNRLATAFFVLMPLGRRISVLFFEKDAQYRVNGPPSASGFFRLVRFGGASRFLARASDLAFFLLILNRN